MEQNTMIAKKIWNLMRVAYYMLKKNIISKRKLLLDLNLVFKRGKIAGKALQNLMFHHHHHYNRRHNYKLNQNQNQRLSSSKRDCFDELSFRSTPFYHTPFSSFDEDMYNIEVVNNIFDMMSISSKPSSPAVLGLGLGLGSRVKQIRITDSPFPLQNEDDGNNKYVDDAAEDFINKFYSKLKYQKYND